MIGMPKKTGVPAIALGGRDFLIRAREKIVPKGLSVGRATGVLLAWVVGS